MASGITFSGFNNIDFSVVISAMMTEASQPLTALQTQQSNDQGQVATFSTLAGKLIALQSAASALSTADSVNGFAATSTDSSAVAVSTNGSGVAGHYDVVVNDLARAQVTASTNAAQSASDIVATGGTFKIGSTTIDVGQTGPLSLQQLADKINADSNAPASAAVVQTATNEFRLVLTGNASGTANAFTVQSTLTGDGALTFGSNAVDATNASALVNKIAITSSSNVLDSVVPGATLTLLRKDPSATVGVDVSADTSEVKAKIRTFVSAYNDFVSFANDQTTAAAGGDGTSIGRDPLMRQLRNTLRLTLSSSYSGGALGYGAQAGIEFTRSGTLQFNSGVFDAAAKNGTTDLAALFAGTSGSGGLFGAVNDLLDNYTETSGIVSSVQVQMNQEISRLGDSISLMQTRLDQQKQSLQEQFAAVDAAMSALNNQNSALTSLQSSLSG